MRYASVCAIAKDEDHALTEWTEYHLRLGFEHIFLFDNGSRNPIRRTLAEFVDLGLVTVIDFPLVRHQQLSAYVAALKEYGDATAWMAFIDIDEFIVPKSHADIRDFLDAYLPYGGLAIHWAVFGSNGHRRRPEDGVIRNYTTVARYDTHVKSIVRPGVVASVASPHHCTFLPGWRCVNEDTVPVPGPRSYHTARTIQINHYYYKSFEDFTDKNQRGLATQSRDGATRRDEGAFEDFARQALAPGIPDTAALRLIERWDTRGASLRELRDCVTRASGMEFAEYSRIVTRHLAAGDPDSALAALRACLRYHDAPQTWIMAAKLHLARKDRERSLRAICRLLEDPDSPYREDGYRCLAEYYLKFGEADTAQSILAELRGNAGRR